MNSTQEANNWRQVLRKQEASKWRNQLREQGRSLAWLAKATGTNVRNVYAYSSGQNRAPDAWLRKASIVLGVEVGR